VSLHLYRAPTWHPRPRRWLPPSLSAGVMSITTDVLQDETGATLASATIDHVYAVRISDGVLVASWSSATTGGDGRLVLSDAALTAVPHFVGTVSNSNADAGGKVYTPA